MKIVSMNWIDVPDGAIVLCPDGVQREIGPATPDPLPGGKIKRALGVSSSMRGGAQEIARRGLEVSRGRDDMTMVVTPETDAFGTPDVVLAFMRAGFTVEVLPG